MYQEWQNGHGEQWTLCSRRSDPNGLSNGFSDKLG
jgi:hypothetical protein